MASDHLGVKSQVPGTQNGVHKGAYRQGPHMPRIRTLISVRSSTWNAPAPDIFYFWEASTRPEAGAQATSQHHSAEWYASNLIHLPDPRLPGKEGDGFPRICFPWVEDFSGAWASSAVWDIHLFFGLGITPSHFLRLELCVTSWPPILFKFHCTILCPCIKWV